MAYTKNSDELIAAAASQGTKLSALDSNVKVRLHKFTTTSASNVATNTVGITEGLPADATIVGYLVETSGTAAGAGVTLSIGLSGGSATSIAGGLDIAANGVDTSLIAPVACAGQKAYLTYNVNDPADGNVITGYLMFTRK
jgi:hypothetical protein